MRNFRKSWLPIYLVAAGAILNFGNEHSARAFTLIERSFVPAVQLVAGQSADIKVTNVSANTIIVVLTTYRDNGTLITQETRSIATGTTFTLAVKAPVDAPLSFRATLGSDAPQAAVADVMTFDIKSSQAIAILPFIKFDTQ
jgi:hypothetical protein